MGTVLKKVEIFHHNQINHGFEKEKENVNVADGTDEGTFGVIDWVRNRFRYECSFTSFSDGGMINSVSHHNSQFFTCLVDVMETIPSHSSASRVSYELPQFFMSFFSSSIFNF